MVRLPKKEDLEEIIAGGLALLYKMMVFPRIVQKSFNSSIPVNIM